MLPNGTMIESALAYATWGWPVFPLKPGAKVPVTEHGFLDATTDPEQIRRWWEANPSYNVGLACGEKAGITVIDVDGKEGIASSKSIMTPDTRVIKTPRGYHLYFVYNPEFHTGADFLPGIDVRTDGGYVVAPPSIVDGKTYTVLRDRSIVPITVTPEAFTRRHRNGNTPAGEQPSWVSDLLASGAVESGSPPRNAAATSLAGYFHRQGVPSDIIEAILTPFAEKCSPPLPLRELNKIIQSVSKYPTDSDTERDTNVTDSVTEILENLSVTQSVTENVTEPSSLARLITAWVQGTHGDWTTDDLDRDLHINTVADKANRRQILHRLRAQDVIEQHPKKNKEFRKRDRTLAKLDFRKVKRTGGVDIRWPLGIENLVRLYPGNLAVVAGDNNAGKTALLLNVARLNLDRFDIHYFSSEMAEEEFRIRLDLFRDMDIDDWNFSAYDRVRDFADVIVPDAINIVDYVEMTDDFHLAGKYLSDIWEKLGKGIGIVALQKKLGNAIAKGAESTMDKSRLYLSLSAGKATIVKGKNPANEKVNPNGLSVRFKLTMGAYFLPTGEWEREGEEQS